MKTRAQVVGSPEIVALRRLVQATFAELGELKKRDWGQSGTPGASMDTIERTGREIKEAHRRHRELEAAHEALVVLWQAEGVQRAAAAALGISDDTLIRRLARADWTTERLRERWPLSGRQPGR